MSKLSKFLPDVLAEPARFYFAERQEIRCSSFVFPVFVVAGRCRLGSVAIGSGTRMAIFNLLPGAVRLEIRGGT